MNQTTDATFAADVLTGEPTVVLFTAPWCAPCKVLIPVLEKLELELTDITFLTLDVEQNRKQPVLYGVSGLPVLLLAQRGQVDITMPSMMNVRNMITGTFYGGAKT